MLFQYIHSFIHSFIHLDKNVCENGTLGEIYVKLPLPPGAMSTIWDNHDTFISKYFEKIPVSTFLVSVNFRQYSSISVFIRHFLS